MRRLIVPPNAFSRTRSRVRCLDATRFLKVFRYCSSRPLGSWDVFFVVLCKHLAHTRSLAFCLVYRRAFSYVFRALRANCFLHSFLVFCLDRFSSDQRFVFVVNHPLLDRQKAVLSGDFTGLGFQGTPLVQGATCRGLCIPRGDAFNSSFFFGPLTVNKSRSRLVRWEELLCVCESVQVE